MGFPGGSVVKNLPANEETQVWSLDWQYSLGKEMTPHFSILAWKISRSEEPDGLQSLMLQKSWPPLSDWACVLEEGKPLIQFGWYLYKKNATWQDKRAHRERAMWRRRQRWGEAATSPGTPKIASKPPEARREPWLRFSLTAFRRHQPWHLDLRLAASRTVRQ